MAKGSDAVAAFYSTHPLTILVASRLSGGYGTYAQTLARHLPQHLPGTPKIAVEPMEEDSGLRLTRELVATLPRDGSVIGAIQGANMIESLLNPKAGFDGRTLNWIGSISRQNNTIITWHQSDIRSIEDARRREVVAGADNVVGNVGTLPGILNATLGTRFRTANHYTHKTLEHALETGEVEAICGFGYSTLLVAHPGWLDGKKINIIAHTGLEADPMMPGVSCIIDHARTEDDRRVIRLMDVRQAMGRPYAAPPAVPAERLAALRRGFAATLSDPAFLDDARSERLIIGPLDHRRMAEIVADAYALPPAVVKRTWALLSGAKA